MRETILRVTVLEYKVELLFKKPRENHPSTGFGRRQYNSWLEVDLRRCTILLVFLFSAPLVAQQQSVPEIPYESIPDALKLPPHLYLGEVAGVAVNSKGHMFVYTRSGHTRLLEFFSCSVFQFISGSVFSGRWTEVLTPEILKDKSFKLLSLSVHQWFQFLRPIH